MRLVEEYINQISREERRAHLKLTTPCVERGGSSPNFKGLLEAMLDTNIPDGRVALLCHACHNGSNWEHLYWGTLSDNAQDYRQAPNYKSAWQHVVAKHGEEGARRLMQKAGATPRKSYGRYCSPPNPNGTCWVTNGVKPIKIKKENLDEYLVSGYRRGRK